LALNWSDSVRHVKIITRQTSGALKLILELVPSVITTLGMVMVPLVATYPSSMTRMIGRFEQIGLVCVINHVLAIVLVISLLTTL
jgi:ABC-type maltose transport system permease subunit